MHKIDTSVKTALFFDFDGVILDSLSVKTDAFYRLYEPFGKEIAEKVADHHLKNGGVSRFEKFYIYHKTFLGKDLSDEEHAQWCDRFSNEVVQGVIDSPEVSGAWDFIQLANEKSLDCFVITGTPTDEMNQILDGLDKLDLFKEVCGSPKKKTPWVEELMEKYGYRSQELVFFGDAGSDRDAAKHHNIDFYLRRHADNGFMADELFEFDSFIEISFE